MAKRYIDLSLTIKPAGRWTQFPRSLVSGKPENPTIIETVATIKEAHLCVQKLEINHHSYTHFDAPRHYYEDGMTNDQVPLESLIGEGVVIDMMHKKPGEGITGADLEASGVEVKKGDMAVIRTGWTDQAYGTERFWREMIYLTADAGEWLIGKGIKALVQDFYTDEQPFRPCECCGTLRWTGVGAPNHLNFLEQGIFLIEWCTNMTAITQPRVTIVCLPLKIKDAEGGPARVIAIEEDDN